MNMLDDQAVAQLVTERVRQSGSSFYWAMRMMSRPRRLAMFAIYAFCREVDDIADNPGTPAAKQSGLAAWRDQIEAVFGGRPSHPLALALVAPVAEYGLEKADLLAVVDGCAMDARDEMVRPSMADLDLYCDRVACAVGRLSVRVFGDFTPRCLTVADTLGRALQLTNILRDVAEDATIGRLYLPDELLTAHGIAGRDPAAVLAHPALPEVCRDLGAVARGHFVAANAAMAECSRRAMRPAALMQAMYLDLLDRCEAADWRILEQRARVPGLRKMWYVLRYAFL